MLATRERKRPMRRLEAPDQPFDAAPHPRSLFAMSAEEIGLLSGAIEVCLERIDEPEFGTRLGAEPHAARALRARLLAYADSSAPGSAVQPGRTPKGRTAPNAAVALTEDDLILANNALNEVCNGLAPADLQGTTLADRRPACRLLSEVARLLGH